MSRKTSSETRSEGEKASAMSAGKAAYEARRAAEAGMSLDAWLKKKAKAEAKATEPAGQKPAGRKNLISRLLDRAHKPL